VEFHDKLNLLHGDNGQGKTSLIEAIHFLSNLKSFRGAKTKELISHGEEATQINAHFTEENSSTWLKIGLSDSQKKIQINEKPSTATSLRGRIRCVVFSPDSLAAIKYGPELRRELVDEACAQLWTDASYAQRQFAKVLRQRNALLKQIKMELIDPKKAYSLLEALDVPYLSWATEITHYRLNLLSSLDNSIKTILLKLNEGNDADYSFEYLSKDTQWESIEKDYIHTRLQSELTDSARRVAEAQSGTTLTGPHRHDIKLLFNEKDSRIYSSQGQQRALILAFKIAEIMYHRSSFGSYPLLLLDDVLSEFDEKKRRFLVEFLRDHEAQTFLTSTDPDDKLTGSSRFKLVAGQVTYGITD
jgi:DNA replication and repair protein RecF